MNAVEASIADTKAAMAAHETFVEACSEFTRLCLMGNWEQAADARESATYHLNAYLDHMATAHALIRLEHGLPWRHSRKS